MTKSGGIEEYKTLVDTFQKSGGDAEAFKNSDVNYLVISGNKILSKNITSGVRVDAVQLDDGVEIYLRVEDGVILKHPVHMCFGIVHKTGKQKIVSHYFIGKGCSISFLAHCIFPVAEDIVHSMDAQINIGSGSEVRYNEVHFHGPEGGIKVIPRATIWIDEGGKYFSEFKLVEGAVGNFDLDYTVYAGAQSVTELIAKLFGKKKDSIKIKESIYLTGKGARGLARTRIVNTEYSKSEVLGEVIGNGESSRGHIDCTEIIEGPNAQASAIPLLRVTNSTSKVTHEAAIGSVDKNQVETLMARGLSENDAIDVIVKGLLK